MPAGAVLVQSNVVPVSVEDKTISSLELPEQIVCVVGVIVPTGTKLAITGCEMEASHAKGGPLRKPLVTDKVTV